MKRPDITNALIHFTGDRTSIGGLTAEMALYSILKDGVIKGSGNSGFIKGPQKATCFTEMPLGTVSYFIEDSLHKHKYEYFGLAFSKIAGWSAGARPVIYLPDDEGEWIPNEEKWRHVQFNHGKVDFTHEREWRLKGDLNLEEIGFYVIVPNKAYEKKVLEIESEFVPRNILGFLHMEYLNDLL